jgi:hypothetical protein
MNRPRQLYLISDDTFNVIIAVVTDHCDPAVDLARVDRSRVAETAKKWLMAINTTPTTSIQYTLKPLQLPFIAKSKFFTSSTLKASKFSPSPIIVFEDH